MAENSLRVLSVEEAACILYSTTSPSEQQLGKVRTKIQKGLLKRSDKGHWTTTPQAIAEYLAARAAHERDVQFAKNHSPEEPRASRGKQPRIAAERPHGDREVSGLYRAMLRDYFLAVALRRRARNRSQAFERAVIAGQAAFLILAAGLFFWGYQQVFAAVAPERAAVERWLAENTGEYQIVEWFPAHPSDEAPDTTVQRVQYKYFSSSHKGIVTDRTFLIRDGQVTEMSQSD